MASVQARFVARQGRTFLKESRCESPLKIAKPFTTPDGGLDLCIMDSSPGLLAGDVYETDLHLEAEARLHWTEQSFCKVHPSRDRPCQLHKRFVVARGALLDYDPQPAMLFRDASLNIKCRVDIEPSGTLLWSDILCAGRVAHGERFAFAEYQSHIEVRVDHKIAWCNQTRIHPQKANLYTLAAWGTSTHWSNFIVFAPEATCCLEALRQAVEGSNVYGGVSLLPHGGIAVSALGEGAYHLQKLNQTLRSVVHALLRT